MGRITQLFQQRQQEGRKVLIPYLVAGDPNIETTLRLMHALVTAGADIIELGIPFSDPSSDGPVIQLGAERAIASGTTLTAILDLLSEFRQQDQKTPGRAHGISESYRDHGV